MASPSVDERTRRRRRYLGAHAFTRFWDVHTWGGVLAGLVLYVMAVTGTLTLFHHELDTWSDPLGQRVAETDSWETLVTDSWARLPEDTDAFWLFPVHEEHGTARIAYHSAGEGWSTVWTDPAAGIYTAEREHLAEFIDHLHYLWHEVTGRPLYFVAGALSLILLLVLVTGVLIHLKDLIRRFHVFRAHKGRRTLWTDLHTVLGVMGLPFQLVYAYTGAVIVLAPVILTGFVGPVFGGDAERARIAAYGGPPAAPADPGPVARARMDLDELAARARAIAPTMSIEAVAVHHHGHTNGAVDFWGEEPTTPASRAMVRLRERDGALLERVEPVGADGSARRWILGLHFASFGGAPLKWVFFLLGLGLAATILTGNRVWLARREAARPAIRRGILARLTAGVGAGLFVALAALFLASRALPFALTHRGPIEELVFFGVFLVAIAAGLASGDERRTWWTQLATAGALALPVPWLGARLTGAGLFAGSGTVDVLAVDAGILGAGLLLLVAAWRIRRGAWVRSEQSKALSAPEVHHA